MKSLRFLAVCLGSVLLLGAISCTGSGGQQGGAPIKVGLISSVTGPRSGAGLPERDTATLAVNAVNKAGGINGRQIALISDDDESDAVKAGTIAKKQISLDNVAAIVGTTGLGANWAIGKLAEENKIPFMSFMNPEFLFQKEQLPTIKYIFCAGGSTVPEVDQMAQYVIAVIKPQKVAILSQADESILKEADRLASLLGAKGITSTIDQWKVNDMDMVPLMLKIKAQQPGAVAILGGNAPAPAAIARAKKQVDLGVPLLAKPLIPMGAFAELAGDAAIGTIFAGSIFAFDPSAQSPEEKAFFENIKDLKGTPDLYWAGGWDSIQILSVGLKKAGDDRAGIRDALEGIRGLKTVRGEVNFTPEDHYGISASSQRYAIKVGNGGKFELVPFKP